MRNMTMIFALLLILGCAADPLPYKAPVPPQAPAVDKEFGIAGTVTQVRFKGCTCGDNCRCTDPAVCEVSACRSYSAAVAAVRQGEQITLSVGVQGGDFHVDTLAGFSPGLYTCWRDSNTGRQLMRPKADHAAGHYETVSECVDGVCTTRRVWVPQ